MAQPRNAHPTPKRRRPAAFGRDADEAARPPSSERPPMTTPPKTSWTPKATTNAASKTSRAAASASRTKAFIRIRA